MLVVRRGAAERHDGRARSTASTSGLRSGHHVALAVAASCLLAVLVAWAALVGPQQVFTGPGPTPSSESATTPPPPPEEVAPEPPGEPLAQRESAAWIGVVVWSVVGAILLWLLLVVGFLLGKAWRAWRDRLRDEPVPSGGDFETLGTGNRVVAAVRADAEAQDAALQEGSPRNAIVAAWHRFELQGERAGLPRMPSETSSEFTRRVLDLLDADPEAVTRLGELYREARFSRHELGEQHREAAVAALAAIRASMGVAR